ncbi:MAG: hypothetical protein ACRYG7_08725 [Janthinobacterium lividum]
MTTLELNDLIDLTVNPKGGGPKIKGPALNALLKTLATELNKAAEAALAPDLLEALAGTAGAPSEANKFVTAADPRLITPPADGSVLEFVFEAGFADAVIRTLGSRQAATYRTEKLQNVGDVTYRVNGNVATLPFAVQSGDTLAVTITRIAAVQGTIVSLES